MEFVKIKDPKKAGDFLVVAKRDFREGVDQPFAGPATTSTAPVPPSAPSTPGDAGGSGAPAGLVESLAEKTVAEATALVAEATSTEELDAVEAAERAGKGRPGVLKAIERKRGSLKG